jgi:probable rRNA maturation factor
LGFDDAELSLSIVDDQEMTRLAGQYLGQQGPTNVLAFPMTEGIGGNLNPEILGDVVISADTAAKEAAEAGTSLVRRMEELLVHGVLHLVGFDHATQSQRREMEGKADELLALCRAV